MLHSAELAHPTWRAAAAGTRRCTARRLVRLAPDDAAAPVRVLVVEDHRMFAEALGAMLGAQQGIEVVGTAATVAGAVAQARRLRPSLVLMDYRLPDGE